MLQRYQGTRMAEQLPGSQLENVDQLAYLQQMRYPTNDVMIYDSQYRSPADLFGKRYQSIDIRGQPILDHRGVDGKTNNPYQTNLVDPQSHDHVYEASELERLLRRFDADASQLPARFARGDCGNEFGQHRQLNGDNDVV